LLGFAGPKAEAEEIKQRLAGFLRDELKLELSQEKTLVTHARTGAARFLGYEISVARTDRKTRRPSTSDKRNRRSLNGTVVLRVPATVVKAKSALYLARGRPACRNPLIREDDYTIVGKFGAEYRGIVQYYLLAGDVQRLHRLRWVMETSMLKTLARKHRSSVSKMAAKHKAKVATPYGQRTCFEASIVRDGRKSLVARFGGIALKRQKTAVITDRQPHRPLYPHKELIKRLLRGKCELCRRTDGIEVHHIHKLADLVKAGADQPVWIQKMAKRRRKTLVVCDDCHQLIHARPQTPQLTL
jgi:Type II intron maturase